MKKRMIISSVVLVSSMLLGCAHPGAQVGPHQQQGRAAGAVTGGVLGGVIGNNIGDGNNQVLGAAIGAALGAAIGDQYGQRQDYIDTRMQANQQLTTRRIVTIKNSNGSFTEVMMTVQGGSWFGPRGERYPSFPTEAQLRQIYGF